jgi:hypothetical protein
MAMTKKSSSIKNEFTWRSLKARNRRNGIVDYAKAGDKLKQKMDEIANDIDRCPNERDFVNAFAAPLPMLMHVIIRLERGGLEENAAARLQEEFRQGMSDLDIRLGAASEVLRRYDEEYLPMWKDTASLFSETTARRDDLTALVDVMYDARRKSHVFAGHLGIALPAKEAKARTKKPAMG